MNQDISKIFTVLYTHQKTKKAKTWQDGKLKLSLNGQKATLFDNKNTRLDTLHLKLAQASPGEEIESDRYLIQIETEVESESTAQSQGAAAPQPRHAAPLGGVQQPTAAPTHYRQRVGLTGKRKRTGFVPPRQVKPKNEPHQQPTLTSNYRLPQSDQPEQHRLEQPTPQRFFNLFSSTSDNIGNQIYGQCGNKLESSVQSDEKKAVISPWSGCVGSPNSVSSFKPTILGNIESSSTLSPKIVPHASDHIVDNETIPVTKRSTAQILALIANKTNSGTMRDTNIDHQNPSTVSFEKPSELYETSVKDERLSTCSPQTVNPSFPGDLRDTEKLNRPDVSKFRPSIPGLNQLKSQLLSSEDNRDNSKDAEKNMFDSRGVPPVSSKTSVAVYPQTSQSPIPTSHTDLRDAKAMDRTDICKPRASIPGLNRLKSQLLSSESDNQEHSSDTLASKSPITNISTSQTLDDSVILKGQSNIPGLNHLKQQLSSNAYSQSNSSNSPNVQSSLNNIGNRQHFDTESSEDQSLKSVTSTYIQHSTLKNSHTHNHDLDIYNDVDFSDDEFLENCPDVVTSENNTLESRAEINNQTVSEGIRLSGGLPSCAFETNNENANFYIKEFVNDNADPKSVNLKEGVCIVSDSKYERALELAFSPLSNVSDNDSDDVNDNCTDKNQEDNSQEGISVRNQDYISKDSEQISETYSVERTVENVRNQTEPVCQNKDSDQENTELVLQNIQHSRNKVEPVDGHTKSVAETKQAFFENVEPLFKNRELLCEHGDNIRDSSGPRLKITKIDSKKTKKVCENISHKSAEHIAGVGDCKTIFENTKPTLDNSKQISESVSLCSDDTDNIRENVSLVSTQPEISNRESQVDLGQNELPTNTQGSDGMQTNSVPENERSPACKKLSGIKQCQENTPCINQDFNEYDNHSKISFSKTLPSCISPNNFTNILSKHSTSENSSVSVILQCENKTFPNTVKVNNVAERSMKQDNSPNEPNTEIVQKDTNAGIVSVNSNIDLSVDANTVSDIVHPFGGDATGTSKLFELEMSQDSSYLLSQDSDIFNLTFNNNGPKKMHRSFLETNDNVVPSVTSPKIHQPLNADKETVISQNGTPRAYTQRTTPNSYKNFDNNTPHEFIESSHENIDEEEQRNSNQTSNTGPSPQRKHMSSLEDPLLMENTQRRGSGTQVSVDTLSIATLTQDSETSEVNESNVTYSSRNISCDLNSGHAKPPFSNVEFNPYTNSIRKTNPQHSNCEHKDTYSFRESMSTSAYSQNDNNLSIFSSVGDHNSVSLGRINDHNVSHAQSNESNRMIGNRSPFSHSDEILNCPEDNREQNSQRSSNVDFDSPYVRNQREYNSHLNVRASGAHFPDRTNQVTPNQMNYMARQRFGYNLASRSECSQAINDLTSAPHFPGCSTEAGRQNCGKFSQKLDSGVNSYNTQERLSMSVSASRLNPVVNMVHRNSSPKSQDITSPRIGLSVDDNNTLNSSWTVSRVTSSQAPEESGIVKIKPVVPSEDSTRRIISAVEVKQKDYKFKGAQTSVTIKRDPVQIPRLHGKHDHSLSPLVPSFSDESPSLYFFDPANRKCYETEMAPEKPMAIFSLAPKDEVEPISQAVPQERSFRDDKLRDVSMFKEPSIDDQFVPHRQFTPVKTENYSQPTARQTSHSTPHYSLKAKRKALTPYKSQPVEDKVSSTSFNKPDTSPLAGGLVCSDDSESPKTYTHINSLRNKNSLNISVASQISKNSDHFDTPADRENKPVWMADSQDCSFTISPFETHVKSRIQEPENSTVNQAGVTLLRNQARSLDTLRNDPAFSAFEESQNILSMDNKENILGSKWDRFDTRSPTTLNYIQNATHLADGIDHLVPVQGVRRRDVSKGSGQLTHGNDFVKKETAQSPCRNHFENQGTIQSSHRNHFEISSHINTRNGSLVPPDIGAVQSSDRIMLRTPSPTNSYNGNVNSRFSVQHNTSTYNDDVSNIQKELDIGVSNDMSGVDDSAGLWDDDDDFDEKTTVLPYSNTQDSFNQSNVRLASIENVSAVDRAEIQFKYPSTCTNLSKATSRFKSNVSRTTHTRTQFDNPLVNSSPLNPTSSFDNNSTALHSGAHSGYTPFSSSSADDFSSFKDPDYVSSTAPQKARLSYPIVSSHSSDFNSSVKTSGFDTASFNDSPDSNSSPQSNKNFPSERIEPKHRRGFKPPMMTTNKVNVLTPRFTVPKATMTIQSTIVQKGLSFQERLCSGLFFPRKSDVEENVSPVRQANIPVTFTNSTLYKYALSTALIEHLNIQLFDLANNYHRCLSKCDTSKYIPSDSGISGGNITAPRSNNLVCSHGVPSKMIQVKKEGPNTGRFFFTCNGQRGQQCKFFKWADEIDKSSKSGASQSSALQLNDRSSIETYFKRLGVALYCECVFLKKTPNHFKKIPAYFKKRYEESNKKKTYIKLPTRDKASMYSKDDLWVISSSLTFDQHCTFLARSVFYGPSSDGDVEIEPINGFSPSNWPSETTCFAIKAWNATNELVCLDILQEYVQPSTMPLLPHLLNVHEDGVMKGYNAPQKIHKQDIYVPWNLVEDEVGEFCDKYKLNLDQNEAAHRVASMFDQRITIPSSIALIHGVFGAGKSFLLAVVVMMLTKVLEMNDRYTPGAPQPSKILVCATTNVAVDRILLNLLDLGFSEFVRVGSVKKITKAILPFSVHATGTDSQELRDLQEMLRSDLTPTEKAHVRKSIEQHRKGENKKKLGHVRVVGATCAACSFTCLKEFTFPVVVVDECSQMTEPSSLLPIARFMCTKLILVGDPNQLNPTLQGAEPAHDNGLEQTMLDRLIKMGHKATILRTQYRCHPMISAIANRLFYNNQLHDGVTTDDRTPLVPTMPTLTFFDVSDGKESTDHSGSYYNESEANFVVCLIERLVAAGVEPADIGVITLYKAQVAAISQNLAQSSVADYSEVRAILISTVDAFQGGERGAIILSCVRTHSVGFIDCDKRTNVALTRSKNHLFIVGHQRNLAKNNLWGKIISHCRGVPGGICTAADFRKWAEKEKLKEAPVVNKINPDEDSSQEKIPSQPKKNRKRKPKNADKPKDSPDMDLTGSDRITQQSNPASSPPMELSQNSIEDSAEPTLHNTTVSDHNEPSDVIATSVSGSNKRKRKRIILDDIVDQTNYDSSSGDDDLPDFI